MFCRKIQYFFFAMFLSLCYGFFLFSFLFSSVHAVSLQELIASSLQNNYQLEYKSKLLQSAKLEEKAQYSLFAPNIQVGYIYNYRAPQNRLTSSSNTVNITGQFNLFNGMRDFYTFKKNQVQTKIQANSFDMNKNDIVLQTKVAYIKILENKETLKITNDSIRLLKIQLNQAEQFFIHGINDKSAVLSMEVKLANARIDHSKVQIELDYYLGILEKLSGLELNIDSLETIEVQEHIDFNKKNLLEEIYARNLEIRNIRFLLSQNTFDKKIAQSLYYPRLDFSVSKYWYLTGANNMPVNSSLQSQIRFDIAWNPVDIYKAYFTTEANRMNALALNAQMLDLRKDIDTEVSRLLNSLEVSKQQLELARIALIQAEENYRIVSNRYQQNITNYIELLNAELLLTDAKSSLVRARYEIALNTAYIEHFKNQYS